MASVLKVDKLDPQSGTALEIGTSGDTVTVPTGAGLTVTDEVKTNKVSPATGTAFALGDSGDTFTIPSGATIDNLGTASGIWYDDDVVQSNIAMLGFKVAVNGSLVKYNLVDSSVDEYEDASGVDAGASSNEVLSGGAYSTTPAATEDSDETGTDGGDTWYKWTDTGATGSIIPAANASYEWLVIAGGGSGSFGGGGAGGLRTSYGSTSGGGASAESNLSLVSGTTYTITIGAGLIAGAGGTAGDSSTISGSDITDVTSVGGGQGGGVSGNAGSGSNGSSGGGTGYNGGSGGTGTANQGFAGGDAGSGESGGGGGGGAGAVGADGSGSVVGGAGGAGIAISITGSAVTYAGGGGGGYNGVGGSGGGAPGKNDTYAAWNTGGAGANGNADANTGGGGGGCNGGENVPYGGTGGSGVVILRTATAATSMTLVSVANTALSTATKGSLVMLMENSVGTATLNTDIKGYVSADGGSNYTQGTFVDEGTWGTNKKILAFHDLVLSDSGTDLRYKIETLNQSGAKHTKIHATSIGWL